MVSGTIQIPDGLKKPCAEPVATGGLGEFALRVEAARLCERQRADALVKIIDVFNGKEK